MITKWMIPIQLDQKLLSLSEPVKRDSQNGSKKLNLTRIIPKKEFPIPKKGNAKECSNYRTIALISKASKEMFKIFHARIQQYINHQIFKLDLQMAEEPEIKLPTSTGSLRKQETSRETSTSALLTMPKPLTVWVTINCGKF